MKLISECGVSINLEEKHANPNEAKTFYNPVMKICREFVLSALAGYEAGYAQNILEGNANKILCLDAFGGTGISGLQWRMHLSDSVQVFVNDLNADAIQSIRDNCERNNIELSKLHSNGIAQDESNNVIMDVDSGTNSNKSVDVIHDDANVTMYRKQFHVIYIDPFGCTVQYLDAAFRNVYHGGLILLTSTDVASLYGKCPAVTSRNYGAYTRRTDYTKEMAVRIVLAQAARSAAKCNKGFDVMYCLAVEHFVHVAVRIKRGANHGNTVTSQINRFMHCLMCAEWAELPNSNNPTEEPYNFLPCSCKEQVPGKTAVIVGPMWSGEIISPKFVKHMREEAKRLKLSDRALMFMSLLLEERYCSKVSRDKLSVVKSTESIVKSADGGVKSAEESKKNTEVGKGTGDAAKDTGGAVKSTDTTAKCTEDMTDSMKESTNSTERAVKANGQNTVIKITTTNAVKSSENTNTKDMDRAAVGNLSLDVETTNNVGKSTSHNVAILVGGSTNSNDNFTKVKSTNKITGTSLQTSDGENKSEGNSTAIPITNSENCADNSAATGVYSILKGIEAKTANSQTSKNETVNQGKRKCDEGVIEIDCGLVAKKKKRVRVYRNEEMPKFYYNLHKRQVKNVNLPRMEKLVMTLQQEGYRACRTHFEAKAIRTDACLDELKTILKKHYHLTTIV